MSKLEITTLLIIYLLDPIKCSSSGRIVGGVPVNEGVYTFSAALYINKTDGNYFCGGSLINQYFILTAASCVDDYVTSTIILGSIYLTGEDDDSRVTLTSSLSIIHPDYDESRRVHDVGLVKTHMAVEYTDYIQPAYLPGGDVSIGEDVRYVGIGWGRRDDYDPSISNVLNGVTLYPLTTEECQKFHPEVDDLKVCVIGNYHQGICNEDTGSPLVTYPRSYMLPIVGIASYHSNQGCDTVEPSVYTRVWPYLEWINASSTV